ncbi:MAG: electron transfer flavoprotein-ubiquinone oxidoreductase [Proteobacteria bacterium]|nr:electron transfer flavoprotein-ubiquinone oxidoreductase [Pseudomonadota bacterium]
MHFDLLIVGGGPAGLAAAIRAKQQALAAGLEISVCLIDKGAEIGAHILSGAVIDPYALDELLPDWQARNAPLKTRVQDDQFLFLGKQHSYAVPHWLRPACLDNRGLFIGSLGELCRWLGREAEALGVEIYPGFAAAEPLFDQQGRVTGILTGEMGRQRDGREGPGYQPGMALQAQYTLFAEGARGHLGKRLEDAFGLRANADPQTFSLGIKELWQVPAAQHQPGLVIHTGGWPLTKEVGGGFIYHYGENLLAIGLIVSLAWRNPWFSPFEEFQRLKTHPALRGYLQGGSRLAYGARTLTGGGLQSLPELVFPGGALIGDEAGFLDPARLKGVHGAMLSGMLAAEAAVKALQEGRSLDVLESYPEAWRRSRLHQELHRARNFKPSLHRGPQLGPLLAGIDQKLLRGRAPWFLHNHADHSQLETAADSPRIDYPKPDGVLSFDLSSSLYLSNTQHTEDQPCHLHMKAENVSVDLNLPTYAAPEQRYCPAGVYEILQKPDGLHLHINAANCLHCKACDIKDPTQNIVWQPPQGGEGPIYPQM